MTLVKWNPFNELETLHEDMDRLFAQLDGGLVAGTHSWALPMDVIETKDVFKIKAALPGLEPQDINIETEGNVLTVSGERRNENKVEKDDYLWIEQQYGTFRRSLTLPKNADTERIEARYRHGVLELTMPRRTDAQRPHRRKIEVSVGDAASRALPATTGEKMTGESWWQRVKRFFTRTAK